MSSHALTFEAVNGLTTAVNITTLSSTSQATAVGGTAVSITVGAQRASIRFGGPTDTVTTSNGFCLPANCVIRLSVPPRSTFIHAIRRDSTDTDISYQFCAGGV